VDVPTNVLLPGERLLWSGRPQRIVPTGLDWYRLVFGLVWVSVIAGTGLPFSGRGISFIGLVFLAFGIAATWVPVIARLWVMRRAVYAVTDRRVVLADRVSGRTRAAAYLAALPPPVTRPRHDGVGTVAFGQPGGFLSFFGGTPAPKAQSLQSPIELVAVPDAERVRDLIAQAQARPA
jgi:hypothetical protein